MPSRRRTQFPFIKAGNNFFFLSQTFPESINCGLNSLIINMNIAEWCRQGSGNWSQLYLSGLTKSLSFSLGFPSLQSPRISPHRLLSLSHSLLHALHNRAVSQVCFWVCLCMGVCVCVWCVLMKLTNPLLLLRLLQIRPDKQMKYACSAIFIFSQQWPFAILLKESTPQDWQTACRTLYMLHES